MSEGEAVAILLLVSILLALASGLALGTYLERQKKIDALVKGLEEQRPAPPVPSATLSWLRGASMKEGTAGYAIAAALNGRGYLGECGADEPVFVLCARDRAASATVRDWAAISKSFGVRQAKVAEALELAERMDLWRDRHAGGGGRAA